MKVYINAKKIHGGESESMKKLVERKLDFLDDFVKEDERVKITFEKEKNKFIGRASVVLKDNYHIHTDSKSGEKIEDVINEIKDDLKDIINRRNKRRKSEKKKDGRREKDRVRTLDIEECDEEFDLEEIEKDLNRKLIDKRKKFPIQKMTEKDALWTMATLGHETFVFRNSENGDRVCMIYKRDYDGNLGIITFLEED